MILKGRREDRFSGERTGAKGPIEVVTARFIRCERVLVRVGLLQIRRDN
jgi:hypothetical protein